jgi:hypothetical protein
MEARTDKRVQIKAALLVLARLFGRSDDPDVLEFIAGKLEDRQPSELRDALAAAARDRMRPGESLFGLVLRHLDGDPETVCALAWAAVFQSICHRDTNVAFVDPAIEEAVEQLGGRGWLGNLDAYGLSQSRRDFERLYLEAARAGGEAIENPPDGGLLVESGTLCGRRTGTGRAQMLLPEPSAEQETTRVLRAQEGMLSRQEMIEALEKGMEVLS